MDASAHPEIFFPLLAITVVWLALFTYLTRYLRMHQPREFERLGSPSFQQGTYRLLGYIFMRGHRKLGDGKFSALCDFMFLWFVAVQALFLYLFYTLLTAPAGA